jgi:hypothetical protein
MKKPKPPKAFEEVEAYIREKGYNVNPQVFWDYYEATGWYDKDDKPVRRWKGKIVTWHYKDKRTIEAIKQKKAKDNEIEAYKQKIRENYQDYLESKSTQALLDIKKDKGQLSSLCSWLIDEILAERTGK